MLRSGYQKALDKVVTRCHDGSMDTKGATLNRIGDALAAYNDSHVEQLSVPELAAKTDQSERTVWRHILGESEPNASTLRRYATVLETTIDELVGEES